VRDDSPNDRVMVGCMFLWTNLQLVSSLWDKVQVVIEYLNAIATCFLNLLGLEQGNELSPFVTSCAMPSDLKDQLSHFFKPPKLVDIGHGASLMIGSTSTIDGTKNTHDESDNNNDEVNNNGEDEDTNDAMDTSTALSPEMIAMHV
jgi:hypothetical protein